MRFIIQRDRSVQSVQEVMKAVTSQNDHSNSNRNKNKLTSEGVTLTGSDSDISIESFIPAEVDGDEIVEIKKSGGIVLHARFLVKLSKSCRWIL